MFHLTRWFGGKFDVPLNTAAIQLTRLAVNGALRAMQQADAANFARLHRLSQVNPAMFKAMLVGIATGADFVFQQLVQLVFKKPNGEGGTLEEFADTILGHIPVVVQDYFRENKPSAPLTKDATEDENKEAVRSLVVRVKEFINRFLTKPLEAIADLFRKPIWDVEDPELAERFAHAHNRFTVRLEERARHGSPVSRLTAMSALEGGNPMTQLAKLRRELKRLTGR